MMGCAVIRRSRAINQTACPSPDEMNPLALAASFSLSMMSRRMARWHSRRSERVVSPTGQVAVVRASSCSAGDALAVYAKTAVTSNGGWSSPTELKGYRVIVRHQRGTVRIAGLSERNCGQERSARKSPASTQYRARKHNVSPRQTPGAARASRASGDLSP